jgi:hypothetical protein
MQRGKPNRQGAAATAPSTQASPAQGASTPSAWARFVASPWSLVTILLLATVIRFWNLDQPKMSADESLHYFPEMQQIHNLPFEQQRRHPTDLYHATSPNPIGHPLFAVQVTNIIMQMVAPTAAVGRGVMAAFGVALVGMIYLLGRDLFDRRYGLMAALMASILPEAVRFNRTLYLDSVYAFLVALLVWLLVRAFASNHPKWYVLAGVVFGLASATKTSGPFLIPLIVGYGGFMWWQGRAEPAMPTRKERKQARRHSQFVMPAWAKLLIILVLGFIVFTIFVDPVAYVKAIREPVDTSYRNLKVTDYLPRMWTARAWFGGVALYLWTPPILIAAVAGLALMIRREWRKPSHQLVLLGLLLLCLAPLIPLHSPGLSGEHGHLPFVTPVTLLASVALMALQQLWRTVALAIIILTMLPATILFGYRLILTPYNSYLNNIDSETNLIEPRPAPEKVELASVFGLT